MHSMTSACRALALGLLLAAAPAAFAQPAASDPRGRWITANGNLEVEVSACGDALCGTVTQVLGNRSMAPEGGEMQAVDTRSPLGMTLLKDFRPTAATEPGGEWEGTIYNRENGKTYRCRMSVATASIAAGELVLHAYVGLPLFGKTQRWTRAPSRH
ncbi:DUF2147 domain-containing protein [Variovorax sp.]|jgi:uncharacterized protein (DUF2147 family)|uniref:DUF2147 domain-containing protein n=1 Tax=Variovorax sp. TaxID=1871043 RepID=UPI0037D9F2A1